jgi:hypothetical protein
MVTSFCRSDFVILGRMTELTEDGDSGHALVAIEEILKDDKLRTETRDALKEEEDRRQRIAEREMLREKMIEVSKVK